MRSSCDLDAMDRQLSEFLGPLDAIRLTDEASSIHPYQNLVNGVKAGAEFIEQNFADSPPFPPGPGASNSVSPPFSVNHGGDSREDSDFSDLVLKYINHMLMEEDMEVKTCMFQESAALQAAEKSFYEALGERYPDPPSVHYHPTPTSEQSFDSCGSNTSPGRGWSCDSSDTEAPYTQSVYVDPPSFSSMTNTDNFTNSAVNTPGIPDIFSDSKSVMQFKRGVEEASKFLPNGNGIFVDLDNSELLVNELNKENKIKAVDVEAKHASDYSPEGSRGKKNSYSENSDLEEGRSIKQSALSTESTVRSPMFDMVLLSNAEKDESALREAMQHRTTKHKQQNGQSKGSNGGKARGKKQGAKREMVDLRTLLTLCAQAVAANDRRNASELLTKIRQHSSSIGDGMQRLAHYFSDGLEARMAGSGTQTYTALITTPIPAVDVLKAYHLYLATCPFRKISNFFSNKTIMNVAENATRIHIIDFGILYGFQWPCLIERLSYRPGGPPRLRITGIDLPHPGFRPSERVEETGRRLANYAETFKVPFQFNAIAQKWETIQLEDLKIDKDEVLVVNCLYRFRNLLDETVVVESPRNIVLNLVKKMKPDVLIQGIVNGSYNAPFFITRFREALFHYSSLFDMLEANVRREIHERMLIEKTIFGWEIMNVIACEGPERIERPETYKQWQVRNLRAGFRQLPLNQEIMNMAKERVNSVYHKDFIIDKDGHWMLQGWKGRIIYALSTWKPAY